MQEQSNFFPFAMTFYVVGEKFKWYEFANVDV